MQYKIADLLDWYMYVNSFFFLIERGIFKNLLENKGVSIKHIKDTNEKDILEYLHQVWVLEKNHDSMRFVDDLQKLFQKNSYNQLLIMLGYKDFFENMGSPYNSLNHKYLAQWSFQILQWKNISYISKFLSRNHYKSFLDLWSWNSEMILTLANIFPKIQFYWLEINKQTTQKIQWYIDKKNIQNISLIHGDINECHKLFQEKDIDVISASFVMHEFISNKSINSIIWNISHILQPKSFILREFCPPHNISELIWTWINEFYRPYSFIHTLSKQKTYMISQWNTLFENNNFTLKECIHYENYDEENSLYPLLHYIKK